MGSSRSVSALLEKGADPNLVDNLQLTPLFSAVEGGHSTCIEKVRSFIAITLHLTSLPAIYNTQLHKYIYTFKVIYSIIRQFQL